MAESSYDASFNADELKFYSDREYEKFLTKTMKNLKLLESKRSYVSDQALPDTCTKSPSDTKILCDTKAENCFDVLGKDSSIVVADNVYNTKAENSYTYNAPKCFESSKDLISPLKTIPARNCPFNPYTSFAPAKISDEEHKRFQKFLNQVCDRFEATSVEFSQNPRPKTLPLKSHRLSCETDSADQSIHTRSQSTSRIPEFNLTEAKAQAKHDFISKRKFYAEQMYQFFNKKVFNNKLPETVLIKWNGQMKSTAGLCKCRRKEIDYSFHIELSPHVLTSFDRLQATLIHEMCHAACWMVNHSKDHHGQLWQTWASRCNLILPEIHVPTRCHNYEIPYDYVLKCWTCPFERKRHKMCEKLKIKTCPFCDSPLELRRLY